MRLFLVMSIAFLAAGIVAGGQWTSAGVQSPLLSLTLEEMSLDGDWFEVGHP